LKKGKRIGKVNLKKFPLRIMANSGPFLKEELGRIILKFLGLPPNF